MRKMVALIVLLTATAVACGGGSPSPSNPTPTTTTPTSTPSTTTTSVLLTASRTYSSGAAEVPSNVPNNMTLNFTLGGGAPGSLSVENVYTVTGSYSMQNGITGSVTGKLGGAEDPLQTGGTFTGSLTANDRGCTAERQYSGPLGPQSLTWTGGNSLRDCPGNPLFFGSFGLTRSDGTPPTTTTSTAGTTSTTTTTTAQSTSTTTSIPGSTTSTTTTTTTAPSTTSTTTTTTTAPTTTSTTTTTAPAQLPDLVPVNTVSCGSTTIIQVNNQGTATAGSSTTRVTFTSGKPSPSFVDIATGPIAVNSPTRLTFTIPSGCYTGFPDQTCTFTFTVDFANTVTESVEGNNTSSTLSCTIIG